MGRKTALHDEHVRLGARLVDFHGWELPVQYEGILAEHRHCREAACLFDTCHMGQIALRVAPEALNRVTTQNAAALPVGRGRYGFLLSEEGGILDDTVLFRLGREEFLLVVNAGPAQGDFGWVKRYVPEAEARLQSDHGWGKLDLQGPLSAQALAPHTDADLAALPYFGVTRAKVCGHDAILSRSGYTGELGYEVFAPGESIVAIFRALAADARVKPAGLGARDSLRLEMGYPLYGEDIDAATTPFEAGLGAFLRFDHDFVGAAALQTPAAEEPSRQRIGFVAAGRQRAWARDELWHGDGAVGVVTSGAFSPSLAVSIGMGYVPARLAEPGTALIAKARRGDVGVTVAEWPLYTQGTRRMKEPLT